MTEQEMLEKEIKELKSRVESLEKILKEPSAFYELLSIFSKDARYHDHKIREIYDDISGVIRKLKAEHRL